jgi:hypothetical protein
VKDFWGKNIGIAILVAGALGGGTAAAASDLQASTAVAVGEQPTLPEDGCVYAGLGYSDRVFVSVPAGVYQCRAQHWYIAPDMPVIPGASPQDFTSVSTQAQIAGDGCIYAGLGFSDGAVVRTAVGDYLCKSHHWDRRLSEIATH